MKKFWQFQIVINISSEDIQRVNGTVEFSEDQTTEVLYGYANDEGNNLVDELLNKTMDQMDQPIMLMFLS